MYRSTRLENKNIKYRRIRFYDKIKKRVKEIAAITLRDIMLLA
jgi:hypothetical protein